MGVNLRSLVPRKAVRLENLCGKSIAIDAYNALYQFLAIIRQPDGTPLKDKTGKITSHLSGLFYRTSNLLQMGIKPIYIFDGVPPMLKEVEIRKRVKAKEEASVKYKEALTKGKMAEARKYAQATSRLETHMAEDSKFLLSLLGIPCVQAPSEGEAQAAHLTKRGDSDYCGSQDYDSLLFGAPLLIRNITISGRRKLPGKNIYIDVVPELIELEDVLRFCEITYEQLIDVGILLGTDFNPDGVKGVGPKTALKMIKKYGDLAKSIPYLKNAEFPVDPSRIKDLFLSPKVVDDYKIEWGEIDPEGVVDFICKEKDFSEIRVRKTLEKTLECTRKLKERTTLEKWFV